MFVGEAIVHYGLSDFTIMQPGGYVICAVSGDRIPIDRLLYWSHERQEAYRDAATSLKGFQEAEQ